MISIVIPYRDRLTHLSMLVPRLYDFFREQDLEIIVAEQADDLIFRRGTMRNAGAMASEGERVIFHDVDYYPDSYTNYGQTIDVDLYLPVKRVQFVNNDLSAKLDKDIPAGYRRFIGGVDDDFYGGVLNFDRETFFSIGGFNPLFKGWGFEDADLRERVNYYGATVLRDPSNRFLALDHPDSAPPVSDPQLQENIRLHAQWHAMLQYKYDSHYMSIREVTPKVLGVHKWLHVCDYEDPRVPMRVVSSTFNFHEGEE